MQKSHAAFVAIALAASSATLPQPARAHPHVFVEANVEFLLDDKGAVSEIRHVWRFDEMFSSTVLLDYDTNGDGKLDNKELDEVSKTVTESIGEYNFYTEVRYDTLPQEIVPPEKIMVDYTDGQILMFFAVKLKKDMPIAGHSFRVAVSDPTYFVAMELADENAIQITGKNAAKCKASIQRPDFDKLYAQNSQTLTEQFFNNPNNAILGDAWLTWVTIECP